MSPKRDTYRWATTKPGESFFVPSVDPPTTLLEGLRSAHTHGLSATNIRAAPCIYKGVMGVMFTLRAPRKRA